MRAVLSAAPPGPVGVAVSGGGDSTALLLLLGDWAAASARRLEAVTVDHGLRAASAAEAASVSALCAGRGVPHATLLWQGWDGRGNLQAEARAARRRLIAAWARERGIAAVALGHTLEDQAETFLMRLARGSGVDGLSGMAAVSRHGGVAWLRPMLGIRRADLRDVLTAAGVGWTEDPSNADARFDRVRARAALRPMAGLGLGPERLAAPAAAMARARAALEAGAEDLARGCLRYGPAGDVTLDPVRFGAAPEELRLRLLAAVLCWVAGEVYRPRLARLLPLADAVASGGLGHGATLHGCVLRRSGGAVAIRREPGRVRGPVPAAEGRWDGRWTLAALPGPAAGVTIAALGRDGLARLPGWRQAGAARETLLTTPALWRGGELLAAPFAGQPNGAGFRLGGSRPGFSHASHLN
jgi:tRNA(Ile)-lysidine synthase